ncbi:MAG: hypothetical protein MUE40_20565, partial [Anaerolineae bacterium]|nr:hypothetical protein [Anaerolineae bacterium]
MLRWIYLAALLLLPGSLALPLAAQSPSQIEADFSGTVITAANAAELTLLARYGRGSATALAWSPEGRRLAVAGSAGVWLYRVTDLDAPAAPLVAHTLPAVSVAFNSDGSRLVSGGADASLRVWDAADGTLLQTLEVPYSARFASVAYSPDDRLIAAADVNTLLLWDADSGTLRAELVVDTTAPIVALSFAPAGDRLAALLTNGLIGLVDVTGAAVTGLIPAEPAAGVGLAWPADETLVRATADRGWQTVQPDGTTLAGGGDDGSAVTALSVDAAGGRVAVGDSSGHVRLYPLAGGDALATLTLAGPVLALAYSPDASVLAALTQSGTLSLLDTDAQEVTATLAGVHQNAAAGVALLRPDGAQLYIGYGDGRAALLEVAGGDLLQTLTETGP